MEGEGRVRRVLEHAMYNHQKIKNKKKRGVKEQYVEDVCFFWGGRRVNDHAATYTLSSTDGGDTA